MVTAQVCDAEVLAQHQGAVVAALAKAATAQ